MALIRRKQFLWKWLLAGLLISMTLLAYIPAMRGGFIWDDNLYVTINPTLETLDGLRRIWIEPGATPQYYPMVFTSFWVQYQLWELQPFAYHLANVVLHALNAVLVWLVLRRLSVPGAWIAAAIFALHPVHLESVAWITERKNVLSGFFYLSSLLVYLRFSLLDYHLLNSTNEFSRNPHTLGTGNRRLGLYLLSVGLFACALLSKSVTCTMPAVILLLLWWKRGTLGWRDVRPSIPLFLLGLAFGTVTMLMEKYYVGAQGEEWALSIVDRFLMAGRALWFYAGKLAFPHKLMFIYPRWQIDSGIWWQYLFPLAAAALVFYLWFMKRRLGKGPLAAVLVFGGTLFPALGFIDFYPMLFSFVADHFQYLASIALIALCVACAKSVIHTTIARSAKPIEYGLSLAVLVILGVLVWHGGYKYKDLETLWRDTIAKNPRCWMAHNNLGLFLADNGRLTEAIDHYSKSLAIWPDYKYANYNLGLALEKLGRTAQAISHYSKALSIDPHFAAAHNNLGLALEKQGKIGQAIRHYSEALRINPDFEEAHINMGAAFAALGELHKAIDHYSEALRINPDLAEAHNNLGLALEKQGRFAEAVSHYGEALRINPDSAEAHNNLGLALAKQGRLAQAISHYTRALRINPDSAAIYINLGNALAAQGKLPEAISHYEKALSIQPGFALALKNLGILYTMQKEYDKALSVFKKMTQLWPDNADLYYDIACIFARQNRVEDSIDWLKKAIERGYKNWDHLKTDKALENIRRTSYYKGLVIDH